ncbi:PucR family transcriptional regulator [Pedococcus sp. P5_B7]
MVAVTDLLADPVLGLDPVELSHPEAEVRWVAASELVDPTPFLEGNEVLLTTGLETVGWRREWAPYVGRLVEAQVAALGVAVGLTHRAVPVGLRRACADAGLNLFAVPRATTFVAISRTAARLIDAHAGAAARRSLDVQRQLTQAALRGGAPLMLMRRLAAVTGGAAAIVDRDGRVEGGPAGVGLDLDVVAAEIVRLRPQGLRAASSVQSGSGTIVVQPVGLTGRPGSWLAVLLPGRPDDAQRAAVTTAVSLLSLAAESRRARQASTRRLRGRALELLVRSDSRTAAIVLGSGVVDEPALPDPVVLLRATGPEDALDDAVSRGEDRAPLLARVGDEVWVATDPRDVDQQAAALAEHGLRVGVGDPAPVESAARSHANAGHALLATSDARPVVRWERLVGAGTIAMLDRPRAEAFASAFLSPLGGNEELLATLRSFLRHHGSRASVAKELGVHRNTVRNRIAQIEEAVGGSLDDPQVRVDAWVALTIA